MWHRERAMPPENVEIVQQALTLVDTARNGDLSESLDELTQRLAELVAPDAEIDMSRRVFNPNIYRGMAGLRSLLQETREIWAEFRSAPERFVEVGDRVVVIEIIRGIGRGSGVKLETRSASIWTLSDGRITHAQIGYEPAEALRAVGLEA